MSLCASQETKGFYFGYFWALYQSAQIFGNLIGAFLVKYTSGTLFFLIMSLIMVIPVFLFLTLNIP
jgi:hypothetical protein